MSTMKTELQATKRELNAVKSELYVNKKELEAMQIELIHKKKEIEILKKGLNCKDKKDLQDIKEELATLRRELQTTTTTCCDVKCQELENPVKMANVGLNLTLGVQNWVPPGVRFFDLEYDLKKYLYGDGAHRDKLQYFRLFGCKNWTEVSQHRSKVSIENIDGTEYNVRTKRKVGGEKTKVEVSFHQSGGGVNTLAQYKYFILVVIGFIAPGGVIINSVLVGQTCRYLIDTEKLKKYYSKSKRIYAEFRGADEELPNDDSEFYFGKDGVTKWKKTMWQKTQIRTRSVNIISQLPGPKSEAKSIESESDAFTKIIDNEDLSRERDAKLTTVTEILDLFGLLIMSGVKRAAHLTYKELWAVDGSGVEIVRAIMSQERFLFILRCLRFDDITTRKERKKLDKLAPIREFVEAFVYNCKKLYTPGEYNTIDEKLIPFCGRCGFRQYMPNKPAKYGLKIYTISDARTFYTFNFEIYCGKQPDGPYKKKKHVPMFSHVTQRSVTLAARIQPPETFNFSTPNEWPKWRKRFERYLVVSGMKKKEEADKIDLFMYLIGDRADDIFRTFKFEKEEEATKIDSVLKAFDSHFCVRKNIIYERAKFNLRIQEDREPVDEFITSLYKLADSCEFEGLHEQLIRDRIVVGVRDKALSERMQLDSELTLEKAVKMVRQQEAVRQQQVDLQRPSTSQKVNQVKFNSKKQSPKQQQQPSRKKEKSAKTRSRCPKCGGFTHREGQACRAEGQKCNLCSKTGHFANCCPDKQAKTAEVKAVSELDEEIGFLLEVSAVEDSSNLDDDEGECRRRWTAEIQVNGKKVKFKLDSQADVTCVPLCLFKKIMGQQRLVESDINLRAAEFSELQTVGMFISTLRNGNYEIKEKIYVIRRLGEPLLSRRACELLNLARRIEVVATRINPIKEFPAVFEGLGQIGNPYEIKLKPGAKPYAVHTPRRVPIPLMEKLKTRLEELEKAGIIAQVNVATEWGAPTVIAGKPNGDIRLCVDLSRLNELVQLEVHPMPVVEHMLGQLGEARFFSKLDANSGFHQIPLSPDCQHLTTFITPFGRYKYCRMPFGISLAPEYFQRVMSIILQGMDGVMCYLDDILIFASDSKTHDRILRLVLRKLKEAKVTLNKAKCVFGVPRINFLGHILDEDGIRPDPAKIEAVAKMPAPTDVHGVRRFLGMVNHLGRKLRTTLPIAPENLNPRLVDSQTLKRKEGRRRKDMKSRYDRRCGATDMEELSEGDTVWITDMRTWGIVKQKASTPRSYMVDTPVGTLRRNRFHLQKGDTVQYPADPSTPTFSGEDLVENEKTPVVDYPSNDSEDGQIRTRSGRIVKPKDLQDIKEELESVKTELQGTKEELATVRTELQTTTTTCCDVKCQELENPVKMADVGLNLTLGVQNWLPPSVRYTDLRDDLKKYLYGDRAHRDKLEYFRLFNWNNWTEVSQNRSGEIIENIDDTKYNVRYKWRVGGKTEVEVSFHQRGGGVNTLAQYKYFILDVGSRYTGR
ncbi:hypothetical protein LAZ67_12000179, partial [Cordylochernes scorpioides]